VVSNDEERNWRRTKAAERLVADEVDELSKTRRRTATMGIFSSTAPILLANSMVADDKKKFLARGLGKYAT
jgi:hypothetical protein